jgi:hypothetical protein
MLSITLILDQDDKEPNNFFPLYTDQSTVDFFKLIKREHITFHEIPLFIESDLFRVKINCLSGTIKKIIRESEAVYWQDRVTNQWYGMRSNARGFFYGRQYSGGRKQVVFEKMFIRDPSQQRDPTTKTTKKSLINLMENLDDQD